MSTCAKSFYAIFLIFITALLAACGGGGSGGSTAAAPPSTIISGTAAAGAPVVGFVSVRDGSTHAQPVLNNIQIAADGKYTVDVKGLTPPFAFLATGDVGGKRVSLYSVANQADIGSTINITPFTDLIVRNVAGTLAGTLVDAYIASGQFASLTPAQVNTERVKLTDQLSPVLQAAGLSTSIDLMRAGFNADGTGLDRFMDLVKVDTTVPTAVTITNILDANNKLTVNSQTGAMTGGTALSATGVTPSGTPTAVDLIRKTLASFSGAFATALPNPATLTALFATSFLDDGDNSGAFLTNVTTSGPQLIGLTFGGNGLVVNSVDTVNGIAQVSFVPVSATGVRLDERHGGVINWQMKQAGSGAPWLIDGDQRIAKVEVSAAAGRIVCSTSNVGCTSRAATGLNLQISNHGLQAIGSAVVKGPGLPIAGVTLTTQAGSTDLFLSTSNVNSSLFEMDDLTIGKLGANGSYTVELFSNATTPVSLAIYTEVVPAAPVLNTALAALAFPALGGLTNVASIAAGGTLTPTWTIPAGLLGNGANVNVFQQSGVAGANGPNQDVQFDLTGKAATGTANFVITAPATGVWTGLSYWIQATDADGGKVFSNYQ